MDIDVTADDVAGAWRPLTPPQRSRAEYLIGRAGRLLNRTWRDLARRVAAGTVSTDELEDAVIDMVVAALSGPGVHGATSHSRTSGPYSESVSFAGDGWVGWLTIPSWLASQLGPATNATARSGVHWLA